MLSPVRGSAFLRLYFHNCTCSWLLVIHCDVNGGCVVALSQIIYLLFKLKFNLKINNNFGQLLASTSGNTTGEVQSYLQYHRTAQYKQWSWKHLNFPNVAKRFDPPQEVVFSDVAIQYVSICIAKVSWKHLFSSICVFSSWKLPKYVHLRLLRRPSATQAKLSTAGVTDNDVFARW